MSRTDDDLLPLGAPTAATLWSKAGHSLRQPVQAALYIAHVLKVQADDDPERLRLIGPLEDALKGLQSQIELLSELSRTTRIAPRPLQLETLLASVIADLQAITAIQGVVLRVRRPISTIVTSDQRLLSMAISGLVLNALRLRTEGPVFFGTRPRRASVRLEVCFHGPPFSEAQTEAAFITLADPRSGRPSGTPALGLGSVAYICRMLGHTLEIAALSGRTQRITLTLPEG